jgi:hypothetical protein
VNKESMELTPECGNQASNPVMKSLEVGCIPGSCAAGSWCGCPSYTSATATRHIHQNNKARCRAMQQSSKEKRTRTTKTQQQQERAARTWWPAMAAPVAAAKSTLCMYWPAHVRNTATRRIETARAFKQSRHWCEAEQHGCPDEYQNGIITPRREVALQARAGTAATQKRARESQSTPENKMRANKCVTALAGELHVFRGVSSARTAVLLRQQQRNSSERAA